MSVRKYHLSSRPLLEDAPCQLPPPALRWAPGKEEITRVIVWCFFPNALNGSPETRVESGGTRARLCRTSDCSGGGGFRWNGRKREVRNTKSSLVLVCAAFRGCWETGKETREMMTAAPPQAVDDLVFWGWPILFGRRMAKLSTKLCCKHPTMIYRAYIFPCHEGLLPTFQVALLSVWPIKWKWFRL